MEPTIDPTLTEAPASPSPDIQEATAAATEAFSAPTEPDATVTDAVPQPVLNTVAPPVQGSEAPTESVGQDVPAVTGDSDSPIGGQENAGPGPVDEPSVTPSITADDTDGVAAPSVDDNTVDDRVATDNEQMLSLFLLSAKSLRDLAYAVTAPLFDHEVTRLGLPYESSRVKKLRETVDGFDAHYNALLGAMKATGYPLPDALK